MNTTLNREAIINAVDTEELTKNLPSSLSRSEKSDLADAGVKLLIDTIFDRENTDVIEVSDDISEEILSTADVEAEELAEDMADDLDLRDFITPGEELTYAKAKELAVYLAAQEITRWMAQIVRNAIEETTGEDPCSWPNALAFPEED